MQHRDPLPSLPSDDEPMRVQLLSEWMHAATLFGKLNGTDWECLLTIAQATWGAGRDEAELGIARFRARSAKSVESIETSLKKLLRPVEEGGFEMVVVTRPSSPSGGRWLRIQTNWERWPWDTELRERAGLSMRAYHVRPAPPPVIEDASEEAMEVALFLREHCLGVAPNAEIPDIEATVPDGVENVWARWCTNMDRLLKRYALEDLRGAIIFVHHDKFWRPKVLGMAADKRLGRNIDTFVAEFRQSRKR